MEVKKESEDKNSLKLEEGRAVEVEEIDTHPHLTAMEFLATISTIIVLLVWSLLQMAPLKEVANPALTERVAKAAWYFMGLQELLVYFDPWIAGVAIPTLIIIGLSLIPYLDPNPKGVGEYAISKRKFAVTIFIFGFSLWFIIIIIGAFFRGPDWAWYSSPHWNWEAVAAKKVVEKALINFSPFWGVASLLGYFTLGLTVPALVNRRFFKQIGLTKYLIVMVLLLLMLGVPLKILLRLLFSVRYIIVTPWFNI